ncbi:MAG: DUF3857 domain-containing protein [Bacteroidota bacterium]
MSTIISLFCTAQEKSPYKFGKIAPQDFQTKIYSIDSNANAVVLSDVGSTEIVGNNNGWFSLQFKRYTRIHILNKNGYDAANVQINLYQDGSLEEDMANLKAVTYNLENGNVVETKLEKSNIFKDKIDKNWFLKKFTLPNIKEGCIIEYQYEIKSDFIRNLQPWNFQGENPVLWSEYSASIPQFFSYAFLSQGYHAFDIKDSKNRNVNFSVHETRTSAATENYNFSAGVTDYRWVMKNVPALKEESFTSTLKNHISRIEFQLTEYKEPLTYRNILGSWNDVGKNLLESEYFGQQLDKNNNWLGDIEKPLLAGAKDEVEKAARIYSYVRDNFTCTDRGSLYLDQTLKNTAKSKNGSEAEINLLLTAMLKYADIKTDPVILSTRSHGYTYPLYPLLARFNYVISRAVINNKEYYFDASVPRLGFGKLMPYCYNGHARVINENVTPLYFSPDSLKERKVSSIFLINDEQGNIKGNMQQTMGYYESLNMRDEIKEKGQDEVMKDIQKNYGEDIQIKDLVFDSLNRSEEALGMKYEIIMKNNSEDVIYFSPMFGESYKHNPFKSAERFYPVEMPYNSDELFIMNMEVPKGYVVDELPKSVRVKLNEEGDGSFEYLVQQQDNTIALRTRIMMKRTFFTPDEYEMLREFFNLIVKKQAEQIVFKKKK